MTRRRTVWPEFTAGVDEAGRGPLAGPLLVAAVILDPARPRINGLADSKVLTAERRTELALRIRERALAFSVIEISIAEIETYNIFHATMLGMTRAVAALSPAAQMAIVDGNSLPKALCCAGRAIVDGDALEPAISAASILAKVARDQIMIAMDALHPGYGFAKHKGYATPEHLEALDRLGPCALHRPSFAPVRQLKLELA